MGLKNGGSAVVIATLLILLILIRPVSSSFQFTGTDHDNQMKSSENDRADMLAFMWYDEYNSSKLRYYEALVQKNDALNTVAVEDTAASIEASKTKTSPTGPMDSAWPMKCHDTRHTSQSPFSTANNPMTEKWQLKTDGWIEDTPVIASDGTIYFGGNYEGLPWYLFAISSNGTIKWMFKTGGLIRGSSPALASDGTIYIGSWDDYLYAINPDGTEKWRFPSGGTISTSPAIATDGTIFFGNFDNKIVALNPDGTEKWHYTTGSDVLSDPAIGTDGTIYAGCWDYYVYALYSNGTLFKR
jgi:outer membrane protein assembly factor BamB